MIPVLPPPVARLVDAGAAVLGGVPAWQPLAQAAEEARVFHQASRERFGFHKVAASLGDAETGTLVAEIESLFEERARHLERIREVAAHQDPSELAERLDAVQRASHELMDRSRRLEEARSRLPLLSPIPYVDDFLRVGVNVFNGEYGRDVLLRRIPVLVSLVQSMEEHRELFAEAHPGHPELAGEFAADIEDLKQAVGAVVTWGERGDPEDLLFGLRLLGIASTNAYRDLARMDRVQEEEGFSRNVYLNLLHRRRGEADPERLREAADKVRAWLARERREIERIGEEFLVRPRVAEEFVPPLEGLLERAETCLEEMRLEELRNLAEELDRTGSAYLREVLRLLDLGGDPEAEMLADAMRGVADGVVPVTQLEYRLSTLSNRLASLSGRLAELGRSDPAHPLPPPAGAALDEEIQAVQRALVGERMALEEARQFLYDGLRERLARALEILEEHHPQVARAAEVITRLETEQRTLPCVRCGARNPRGAPCCSECRAPLPVTETAEMPGVDLVAAERGPAVAGAGPGPLFLELRQVCRAWLAGQADRSGVEGVLRLFETRLEFTRSHLASHVLPASRESAGDPGVARRAAQFQEVLQRLEQGVVLLHQALGGAFPDPAPAVEQGLEAVLSAGEGLRRLHLALEAEIG